MNIQISHGGSMNWHVSPARGVRRKRLFHSGDAESGVVTSIVRYAAGSVFPEHGHPEGEEMLVLDGTFSDERGDFSRGSYLLNPEGFRHAPFSRRGCTVFVKLRQYAGRAREHVSLDTTAGQWIAGPWDGTELGRVRALPLYESPRYPERIQLVELAPGTAVTPHRLREAEEYFVISGQFSNEYGVHPAHSWLSLPAGSAHGPSSVDGALLYVRRGGAPAADTPAP